MNSHDSQLAKFSETLLSGHP